MDSRQWQAEQFEQSRGHLRAVAQRMLGSVAEADDAVQEAWFRWGRAETAEIQNIRGWLTTVVSRICLDMLRARQARREEFVEGWLPEPVVTTFEEQGDPEHEALLADSVGLAMLVVLETLSPAERLAFVLHDMFGMPFEEIAPIVERNVPSTRQLASRARRRVRGADEPQPPPVPTEVRGAEEVANVVLTRGAPFAHLGRPAILNGRAGAVVAVPDRVMTVVAFTIEDGRVTEMGLLADPEKLRNVPV